MQNIVQLYRKLLAHIYLLCSDRNFKEFPSSTGEKLNQFTVMPTKVEVASSHWGNASGVTPNAMI